MRQIELLKVVKPNFVQKWNFATKPIGSLHLDDFDEYFQEHHVPINCFQKMLLTIGSATVALVNPYRADMVAYLGETTGEEGLPMLKKH